MELTLLKIVAFSRPLASMKYFEAVFAILGIGLFAVIFIALLMRGALRQSLRLSSVDGAIFAFSGWCLAAGLIYFERLDPAEMSKLLIPLLSYTLVKNVVSSPQEYRQVMFWAILGFVIPILLSALLIVIAHPGAVDMVMYYTGVTRWQGVYTHSHNLGHSMTLVLMVLALFATIRARVPETVEKSRVGETTLIVTIGVVALYCLYMSQVRSALLGLITFALIYLYFYNKKLLLFGTALVTGVAVLTIPYWAKVLFPELAGDQVNPMELGSGRPRFWLNDLTMFLGAPLDQQLAGINTGRLGQDSGPEIMGHSDWLELVTRTGIVGLLLFATVQVLILRKILRLPPDHRYAFLALFVAVNVMMFVSNSYAWRIQVSHLYYMVLAFVEVPLIPVQQTSIIDRRLMRTA